MFDVLEKALFTEYSFAGKDETRAFMLDLQQTFIDWNDMAFESDEFVAQKEALLAKVAGAAAPV